MGAVIYFTASCLQPYNTPSPWRCASVVDLRLGTDAARKHHQGVQRLGMHCAERSRRPCGECSNDSIHHHASPSTYLVRSKTPSPVGPVRWPPVTSTVRQCMHCLGLFFVFFCWTRAGRTRMQSARTRTDETSSTSCRLFFGWCNWGGKPRYRGFRHWIAVSWHRPSSLPRWFAFFAACDHGCREATLRTDASAGMEAIIQFTVRTLTANGAQCWIVGAKIMSPASSIRECR